MTEIGKHATSHKAECIEIITWQIFEMPLVSYTVRRFSAVVYKMMYSQLKYFLLSLILKKLLECFIYIFSDFFKW